MRHISPLRYPGGKGGLSDFLSEVICLNSLEGCPYFEPYAGGAGAALRLLTDGIVSKIYLNDADFRIYAFWRSVLDEPERFINSIQKVDISIDQWRKQREVLSNCNSNSMFDVGFATFFINRCSRAGIISTSGPIGGYGQKGTWKINARYSVDGLVVRVKVLQRLKESISISNLDAIEFLKKNLPAGPSRKNAFVYLDPPYYGQGNKLYMNFYDDSGHRGMAQYLQRQKTLPWIMTYDDETFIKEIYSFCEQHEFALQYSAQKVRKGTELLIHPNRIRIPAWSENIKFIDAA